jgi:hypothetical protein
MDDISLALLEIEQDIEAELDLLMQTSGLNSKRSDKYDVTKTPPSSVRSISCKGFRSRSGSYPSSTQVHYSNQTIEDTRYRGRKNMLKHQINVELNVPNTKSFMELKKTIEMKEYAEKVRIENKMKENIRRHTGIIQEKVDHFEQQRIAAQQRRERMLLYASNVPRPQVQRKDTGRDGIYSANSNDFDLLKLQYYAKKNKVDEIRESFFQ